MPQDTPFSNELVIQKLKAQCPNWNYRDGSIVRLYKTNGWPQTLMLVNAIGFISEAAWHHPDLDVSWNKVLVKLSTHSAKGITDKDFKLAQHIEEHVLWLPQPDSPLHGYEKNNKNPWIK